MCASRHIRVSGAVVLGVLLGLSGCVSPSKPQLSVNTKAEALSHFSLGLLAETGGDSAAALDHLKAAIRLDPDEEKLYAPAMAIALKLDKPDDAVGLAQALVKRRPGTAEPLLLLARVYAVTKHPEQAETLLKQALSGFPEHPETPVLLAKLYISQNRRTEAMETLRTAAATQSRNAELFHLLGTLCIDNARTQGNTLQARAAVEAGIVFLQKALDIEPEDPVRWQHLGFALLEIQKPEAALGAFRTAHEKNPGDLIAARQVMELLIATGKIDEAMASYEQIAEETGTEPEAWLQYIAEKLPKDAQDRLITHLEKQIQEEPKSPVFFYAQLGALYIGAHKNQEAEAVLLKARGYYPEDNRLRIVLGYLHLQQERYTEAYTDLEYVRTKAPAAEWSANPFFLINFLVSAQKSGHLEEAAKTLADTYTENPVVLNQYMSSLLTGQTPVSTENAIELLNVFHTLSPEAAEALYYLMVLQAEQKEYQKAIETAKQFEALVQKSGNTNLLGGQFYYQYASLCERSGQFESAEKLFFKVIDLGGDAVPAAQNYLAYMWADRGEKLDQGLALIRKALEADPENGAFLDTLGWIYYRQGRYADALKELQKALCVVNNDADIWTHLGDTYLKLGNRNAAIEHWEKALEIDPKSQELRDRLNAAGIRTGAGPAPADSPADTTIRP